MFHLGWGPQFKNLGGLLWHVGALLGRLLGPGLVAGFLALLVDVGLFDGQALLQFVDELARELRQLLAQSKL